MDIDAEDKSDAFVVPPIQLLRLSEIRVTRTTISIESRLTACRNRAINVLCGAFMARTVPRTIHNDNGSAVLAKDTING